jgi:hypothetical protein
MTEEDINSTNNVPSEHETEPNDSNNDNKRHYKHHKHRNPSPKQQQIEWRRQKVYQLLIMGLNSYEIADTLKITSRPTITRDIQIIKEQSVSHLRHHITNRLPFEFERCLENNNLVTKEAWRVVQHCDNIGDNRTKLQALALIEQSTSHRIELLTNGHIVQSSIEQIEHMKEEVERLQLKQLENKEVT